MDQAAALPGGYVDQVARREQFERDHPDTEISHDAPDWAGPAVPQPAGEGSAVPKVTFRRELFLLRQNWGSAYAIVAGDEPGTVWVKRRDGLGEPMQGTPAEVTRLIAADYRRQPVPRDVAP